MSTRKRSTSGSKKQFKEKIVQIYEAFFRVSLIIMRLFKSVANEKLLYIICKHMYI